MDGMEGECKAWLVEKVKRLRAVGLSDEQVLMVGQICLEAYLDGKVSVLREWIEQVKANGRELKL